MFRERVRAHLLQAGWSVEDGPVLRAPGGPPIKTDFRIQRRNTRLVVLVREEAPGAVEVARFGALCRRAGWSGMLVAPDDASVADLCAQAHVDFFPGERIGALVHAAPRAPRPRRAVATPARVREAPPPVQAGTPWWRWAVVAVIWALALSLLAYDAILLFG